MAKQKLQIRAEVWAKKELRKKVSSYFFKSELS